MRFMKKLELERLMEKYADDAEIFIQDDNGLLHDFKVEHRAESFDGFDTAYDEGIDLILID